MIFLMSHRCVRTRSFICLFWWPFHSLLPCYHMVMGGRLPLPFSTAAIQNSPLFSRPWTPTSAILEGERTYSLFEEIEIIRQELHLLSPTYSNISPPSVLTTFILKETVLSKGEHPCPWSCPFSPLTSWPVNYPFTSLVLSLSTGSLLLFLK